MTDVDGLPDVSLRIDGVGADGASSLEVVDPWTREPLAEVPLAGAELAARAASAAASELDRARRTPAHVRARWLRDMAAAIDRRAGWLERIMVHEVGKPRDLASAEIARARDTFSIAAEEATRNHGETLSLDRTPAGEHLFAATARVPRGPVLAIAPFNFPLNLAAHKVAPALACGAPVVLKPSPRAPLTAYAMRAIAKDCGVPDALFQVVPCADEVTRLLVADDRFATLSFTGSAEVGWALKGAAGRKSVTLELGGNAACVVHEDAARTNARVDALADALVASAFAFAGQVCIKTQRIYAHRSIADRLIEALAARTRALEPRDPATSGALLGPMIDEAAAARVDRWVEDAIARGANPLVRGERRGNRLGPSLLEVGGDGRGLAVVDEEVFGPVLTVLRYDDFDEALARVDGSRYGLQASLFTDSLALARRAFDRLDVGALVVNDVPSLRVDAMPYGGVKHSGIGREGVRYAIEEMTRPKLYLERVRPE